MTIRQDLFIQQGATWAYTYTHRDSAGDAVDLTGYTARMSIKAALGGSAEAYLSTGADASGGTITLGGAAGTVALAMTATQTANMSAGVYIYDLELVSGDVTRAIEGRATVQGEVTG